jgi:flagellum-specific ATP synthase
LPKRTELDSAAKQKNLCLLTSPTLKQPKTIPVRNAIPESNPLRPLARLAQRIDKVPAMDLEGRVRGVNSLVIEASGPPEALILGARAEIEAERPLRCEIVGFRDGRALLIPYDAAEAIRPGARVRFAVERPTVSPCAAWLGHVLDAFGRPLGGHRLPQGSTPRPIIAPPPAAHGRARVGARMDVGVRAINLFAALCRGQRMGVFAGSGVGKSVLLSMLARAAAADVIVIALVGERGREVNEFIEDTLGPDGRRRSIVVVATSDETAAKRRMAPHTACAIAEHFRDEGKDVLLLVDSVTRFAMAQREIGLAAGEPPTTRGYTPSVFAELPRLLERAGPGHAGRKGSVTGLFTVLVDGDDHNEPVADAVRGILDGHIVMERSIAEKGHYPAINVLKSISRLMPMCHADDENALVRKARALMAAYAQMEDLIRIGAYKPGSDVDLDEAIRLRSKLDSVLNQDKDEFSTIEDSFARLRAALGR